MRLKVMKTRTMPIGIDLGSSAVKVVQLRRVESELELTAAARMDIPAHCQGGVEQRMDFLAERLQGLLKSQQFKGRRCVLALPAEATFVQHVRTPKLPPEALEQALRAELEGKLPYPASEAVLRSVVAAEISDSGGTMLEMIVVAARRGLIDACIDLASRNKLAVTALNVEPCAIVECFARLFRRSEDQKRATLFLDLGQSNTQVVIAHGGRLVFARNLAFGARKLHEAASARLGISVEEVGAVRGKLVDYGQQSPEADHVYDAMREALETVVEDVRKCLCYYDSVFPSLPVERAIFLGGQARDKRLCHAVAQRIHLPAQVGDPLARIGRPQGLDVNIGLDRRQAQPAWAVAVGLSLGAELPCAA